MKAITLAWFIVPRCLWLQQTSTCSDTLDDVKCEFLKAKSHSFYHMLQLGVCLPAESAVSSLTLLFRPCFHRQPVGILQRTCHTTHMMTVSDQSNSDQYPITTQTRGFMQTVKRSHTSRKHTHEMLEPDWKRKGHRVRGHLEPCITRETRRHGNKPYMTTHHMLQRQKDVQRQQTW